MIRSVLVLLMSLTFLPSAMATISPRHEPAARRERVQLLFAKVIPVLAQDPPYRITEKTEVMLNGRECRYEEVPSSARIIFMEIDSEESKVILRIHFQDRK